MDERDPILNDLETMQPKHSVSTRYARANGVQIFTAALEVSCAETHSARTEMVELLRALAADIEIGVA